MRLKMKSRSQRCDKNKPRARYGQKYTKYKMCLSIMVVVWSNIWSSIHEKLSNSEAELNKSVAYKKACS